MRLLKLDGKNVVPRGTAAAAATPSTLTSKLTRFSSNACSDFRPIWRRYLGFYEDGSAIYPATGTADCQKTVLQSKTLRFFLNQ